MNKTIQRFFNQYELDTEALVQMNDEERQAALEALREANGNYLFGGNLSKQTQLQ